MAACYTNDVNDPRVNVWVGGATSGVDQALGRDQDQKGPHGELKKLLDSQPRCEAVVSLRCTGWGIGRARRRPRSGLKMKVVRELTAYPHEHRCGNHPPRHRRDPTSTLVDFPTQASTRRFLN